MPRRARVRASREGNRGDGVCATQFDAEAKAEGFTSAEARGVELRAKQAAQKAKEAEAAAAAAKAAAVAKK